MGASRAEATSDLLTRSVRLAMTPLLNQMSVVGLVSIPGMMTGQVRGGEGKGCVCGVGWGVEGTGVCFCGGEWGREGGGMRDAHALVG